MYNISIKKVEMYIMISCIENDIIGNILSKSSLDKIPLNVKERLEIKVKQGYSLEDLLRAANLQDLIEIINNNIIELNISSEAKKFINGDFSAIVPIRNKVMHPRLIGFYDFPILKECFNQISVKLDTLKWENVTDAKNHILNDTTKILNYNVKVGKKSDSIIENIPSESDFEETSFIGRKREVAEIKELLKKPNVHTISIVGEGGIGKTAIAVKLLYDLLDSEDNNFELILWTSLKTNELNKYEFKKIENSITSLSNMYDNLNKFIGGGKEHIDSAQSIINVAKSFKTLLVLDNLETINSDSVKSFIDQFTVYGKVIITSRIGLQESEKRYPLEGMSSSDTKEYTEILLDLYGLSNIFSSSELDKIINTEFHGNPLAIKWFIRSLHSGKSVSDVLMHKNDLINFSMSNVYDKLSDNSKYLLSIINYLNRDLTYAELFIYTQYDQEDDYLIRKSINELISSNFLDNNWFKSENQLRLTSFAKDYLTTLINGVKIDSKILNERQQQIKSFEQEMIIKYNENKYKIGSFMFSHEEKERIVSAYYLYLSLDSFHKKNYEKSYLYLRIAKKVSYNYFECNKIEALYNAKQNPEKSEEQFDIALSNSKNEAEKSIIYVHYGQHLLKSNDYFNSKKKFLKAAELSDDQLIVLEIAKVNACMGEFDEAVSLIKSILEAPKTKKIENIAYTRWADVYRRKADRERNIEVKIIYLKEAINTLMKSTESDTELIDYVAVILVDLAAFYYDTQVLDYIINTIHYFGHRIKKSKDFKKFSATINANLQRIDEEKKEVLLNMIYDYNSELNLLDKNQAVVYTLKDGFGFIKNNEYNQGIYFSFKSIDFTPMIGDIVQFDDVLSVKQGNLVTNLILVRRRV